MRYLRLILGVVLALACAGLAVLSSGDTKADWDPGTPQFQPTFDVKLCNDLADDFNGPSDLQGDDGTCTPDTTPEGNPDTTLSFAVPPGHMNYDQGYYVVTGGADETRLDGSEIDGPNQDGTGAAAGGLETILTVGVGGTTCANTIVPDFILWEAEYDVTDTVACQSEGTEDRWDNMAYDGDDDWYYEADNDSPAVTEFPDCTVKLFDPDGDGVDTDSNPNTIDDQPVQPRARFVGLTKVGYYDWQMVQVLEFDPGDLQEAFQLNTGTTQHPYAKLRPELGFVTVVVLNDPTAVILQPNPFSDFCSYLGITGMLKGEIDEDGDTSPDVDRVTMPATEDSYPVQARTASIRDADGDGLENSLDTCAWTANTAAEDPYDNQGPDGDMLDSACDPAPGTTNTDQDGDDYKNSQDWCPLVANSLPGGETDSENSVSYNTSAPDGGPRQDFIGDDCDSEQGGDDTESDGLYFNAIHVDSVCITDDPETDDADSDGWCDPEDPDDSDADDPGQMTHVEVDAAGNPTQDSDGDGYTNVDEWGFIGTDAAYDCPLISDHDAWPPDFDTNRVINITDVFVVNNAFGSSCGQPAYSPRADLAPNCVINITDMFKVLPPVFGSSCTP